MYQQHGIGWPGLLREPRVGIGALAFGMAAAFVAGWIAVTLVAGNAAAPPAAISIRPQNPAVVEDRKSTRLNSSH